MTMVSRAGSPALFSRKRWTSFAASVVIVGCLALLPLVLRAHTFELRLMTIIFLYALLGQGWNVIGGLAGQTSIGHGVFFGVGAYTSTLSALWLGTNPWFGMVLGASAAALLGVAIGLPCFRLRGHYFVIATLVVAEIVYQLVIAWPTVGGASGLSLPLRSSGLLAMQFNEDRRPYYYIALAMVTTMTVFVWWLKRSRFGYILQAIRDDEDAARSLGFSPARYKLLAMALSAASIGAGGVFYAQYVLFIDPSSVLALSISVIIALVPIFGGVGTVLGPVVGAGVLVPISEYSRVLFSGSGRNVDLLIYGFLIMLIAVYRPRGVMSLLDAEPVRRITTRLGLS